MEYLFRCTIYDTVVHSKFSLTSISDVEKLDNSTDGVKILAQVLIENVMIEVCFVANLYIKRIYEEDLSKSNVMDRTPLTNTRKLSTNSM